MYGFPNCAELYAAAELFKRDYPKAARKGAYWVMTPAVHAHIGSLLNLPEREEPESGNLLEGFKWDGVTLLGFPVEVVDYFPDGAGILPGRKWVAENPIMRCGRCGDRALRFDDPCPEHRDAA